MLLAALFTCAYGAPQGNLPTARLVAPEKVTDFPGYTEGIAFDAAVNAYVSAGRNPQDVHAVYRIVPGAPPTKWLQLRIPNGHEVLADGSHVIAAG